jgi:hypothetical protein
MLIFFGTLLVFGSLLRLGVREDVARIVVDTMLVAALCTWAVGESILLFVCFRGKIENGIVVPR